jgi:thiamine pyrophosphate-dependent acetolactate synthase large subunit-like protein
VVISGDGACLMSLGTLALHKQFVLKGMTNLSHIIIDNNCHNSTGGQKTCSSEVDFMEIGPEKYTHVFNTVSGKTEAPRISLTCEEITRRFKDAIIRK